MEMKLLALFSLTLCVNGAPHTFSTFLPFHHQLNNHQYIQLDNQQLHQIGNQQYQQYYYTRHQTPFIQTQLQLIDYQHLQVPLAYTESEKPVSVLQYYTNPTYQYQPQPLIYWQLNARNEITEDKETNQPEGSKPLSENSSQETTVIAVENENESKDVEKAMKEPVEASTSAPVNDAVSDYDVDSISTGVELPSNDSGENEGKN